MYTDKARTTQQETHFTFSKQQITIEIRCSALDVYILKKSLMSLSISLIVFRSKYNNP